LFAKHAAFDYAQAYRDGANKLHDRPHQSARQYDPSSWKVYDLGPGKGLSVGYTAEQKTQLAPSTASSVEDMTTTPSNIIHPGFSATRNPRAFSTHLDPVSRKWVREAPKLPTPNLDINGTPIKTFDIRRGIGKNVDRGLHKLPPPEPLNKQVEAPGVLKSILLNSGPLGEAFNLWHS
jgi:hypothetical protein